MKVFLGNFHYADVDFTRNDVRITDEDCSGRVLSSITLHKQQWCKLKAAVDGMESQSLTPEEQVLQNRVWELETRVTDQSKTIYVLNKLVLDIQRLAKRHSCVLKGGHRP